MTYLNLVNNVLRRLREDEVTSVQESTYSKMVGDFVNDAKRTIEDSWDWSALRTTLTITTTADVFNYVLTGSQNRIKALNVINDTANLFMEYQTATFSLTTVLIATVTLRLTSTQSQTKRTLFVLTVSKERLTCLLTTTDL